MNALRRKFVHRYEIRAVRTDIPVPGPKCNTAPQLAEVLLPLAQGRLVETMWAAFLDPGHRLLGVEECARGSGNVVHVSLKDIFRTAFLVNAAAVAFAHNHPSGDVVPSDDDLLLTTRFREACGLVGIRFLDHLVLADSGDFFSIHGARIYRAERREAA